MPRPPAVWYACPRFELGDPGFTIGRSFAFALLANVELVARFGMFSAPLSLFYYRFILNRPKLAPGLIVEANMPFWL